MRTTIRLDEALLREAKARAARSGRSLNAFSDEALQGAEPLGLSELVLAALAREAQCRGNLVSDAFHAALAIEVAATWGHVRPGLRTRSRAALAAPAALKDPRGAALWHGGAAHETSRAVSR